ncbi:hypothetical protein AGMMS49545_21970 [Betaproteobacteria bacterium]|nr:hypothetical protein AGMMS49545_21970 [Betaproteobacteria bacterium]GHU49291.1 hypothetical protein AGMMS50289_26340 [Betaproteobacteria bacterium]
MTAHFEKFLQTGKIASNTGANLWRFDGETDIEDATRAIEEGWVRGLWLSKIGGFKKSDISSLLRLPDFQELWLNDLRDVDVSCISHLAGLKYLTMEDDHKGDISFSTLNQLKVLRVGRKYFSQADSILEQLEILDLRDYTGRDLMVLSKCTSLTGLSIIGARKLESMRGIENSFQLGRLEVCYCQNLVDVGALRYLCSLKYLEIMNARKIVDLSPIAGCTELLKLILVKVSGMHDIDFLQKNNALQHLAIRDSKIINPDVSVILKLPNLNYVHFSPMKPYKAIVDIFNRNIAHQ